MRLRASLHWVFSTLMCFLKERCESHHSPRNFVDSSTGRSVSPIVIVGGLVALCRVWWNAQLYIYGMRTWNHSLLPTPVWHLQTVVHVYGIEGAPTKTDSQVIDIECSEDVHGNMTGKLIAKMCETKRLLATVTFANGDDYKHVYCVLCFSFFFFHFKLFTSRSINHI